MLRKKAIQTRPGLFRSTEHGLVLRAHTEGTVWLEAEPWPSYESLGFNEQTLAHWFLSPRRAI